MKTDRLIVVGHYYANREHNLYEIINHLTDLDYRVVVWDNNPQHQTAMPTFLHRMAPQVQVVRCPNNPIHGRYLAALIYPEVEYFLFQDDDLLLEKDMIEKLFEAAKSWSLSGTFVGIEGRKLDWASDKPYTNAKGVTYPENADMLVRAYACHRWGLESGFQWILDRGISPGRCETLLFTRDCRLVEGTRFKNLPEHGVGLCHAGQAHWDEIDKFANEHIPVDGHFRRRDDTVELTDNLPLCADVPLHATDLISEGLGMAGEQQEGEECHF